MIRKKCCNKNVFFALKVSIILLKLFLYTINDTGPPQPCGPWPHQFFKGVKICLFIKITKHMIYYSKVYFFVNLRLKCFDPQILRKCAEVLGLERPLEPPFLHLYKGASHIKKDTCRNWVKSLNFVITSTD